MIIQVTPFGQLNKSNRNGVILFKANYKILAIFCTNSRINRKNAILAAFNIILQFPSI